MPTVSKTFNGLKTRHSKRSTDGVR